jgi:glycosyltransferase involved in cell wall biosynthesis
MERAELIVVLPVYNEEANIAAVLAEWRQELERLCVAYTIVAVDDGSRDSTSAVLARLAAQHPGRLHVLDQVNSGHGRACRAGYDWAVATDAPWVLQIDSDGQCDPAFFAAFWQDRRKADCLFGLRTTRDDGALRHVLSTACRLGTYLVCGVDLKDANVPYRLIRSGVLRQALDRIPPDFDMQNVALTLALRRDSTTKWRFLPIHFRGRRAGTNSINLRRIAAMGWTLLRDLKRIS